VTLTAPPAIRRLKVLVVEDDPAVRHLIDIVLTSRGHLVLASESAALANSMLLDFPAAPSVGVLDLILTNDMDGLTYGGDLRERFPAIRLVYMTGWLDRPERAVAETRGLLLAKPFALDDLIAAVES